MYAETLTFLRAALPEKLRTLELGVVCGSGLGGLLECFDEGERIELDYKDIPNFPQSTVPGHAGKLVFGTIGGIKTVCMLGRLHVYEGHEVNKTAFPIRIMHLLSVSTLIVTNASGGLNADFKIGDFMIIKDHVSLAGMSGQNPLIGPNIASFGPRFPPVSEAYNFDLRVKAVKVARELGLVNSLREGIYVFVTGPSFETRAESRFLRDYIGADCVGMSTVPEVIVAKHCGMKVLGLSMITNKVAVGFGKSALNEAEGIIVEKEESLASHSEVLETSSLRSKVFINFVRKIIETL